MLKNYLKITWRSLTRNKVYSLINILGLASGISACILIFLFVQNELSYDSQFSKADRIYRVTTGIKLEDVDDKYAVSSPSMASTMIRQFPEVEEAVRLRNSVGPGSRQTVHSESNNKFFNEEHIYFADSNFFKVFDYPFLAGDPNTALSQPKTIVLSEAMAIRYFGSSEAAMGQMLRFYKRVNKVTGVFRDARQLSPQV